MDNSAFPRESRRFKKLYLASFAFLMIVIGLWALNRKYALPPRALEFTISPLMSSNGFRGDCIIIASNCSDHFIQIVAGDNHLQLDIAYRTNQTWYAKRFYAPGRDDIEQVRPREFRNDAITLPQTTKGIKVGMAVTSLTWRGRLAWWIYECPAGKYLRPVEQYFRFQDEKTRSKQEWSEECRVN